MRSSTDATPGPGAPIQVRPLQGLPPAVTAKTRDSVTGLGLGSKAGPGRPWTRVVATLPAAALPRGLSRARPSPGPPSLSRLGPVGSGIIIRVIFIPGRATAMVTVRCPRPGGRSAESAQQAAQVVAGGGGGVELLTAETSDH